MKMNEEATFAVYQKKLKGICEENDLQATFNRSSYPLTMTVRPLQDVADQMSMLEKVEDNGYTSPDASIKFSYEDGAIKYTLSKEFVISDALGDMDEDTIEAVYGDGIYNDEHDLDTAVLMENAQVNPMKMLMVLLFALTEPVNHRVHDTEWLGGFYKCIKDDESVYPGIYSALDGIGYEISDMEKSLLDGTHPSYESAEEES